jgi:uncharacterized protein YndB with AHSA1/START domain
MPERMLPDDTEKDVHISRTFDAPIAVVWRFWTEPDMLAQWFGPHGIAVDPATVTVEPKAGGAWNLTMHDDHGVYPIAATIVEADEPHYLEILMSAQTEHGTLDDVLLRIQFHDHGERTRMTMLQGPFTPGDRELTENGWTESFEKLDGILAGG